MLQLAGMAYSDAIILEALRDLLRMFGSEAVISQHMIADHAGVPAVTTARALKRLMAAGKIEGRFQRGIGYRYTIANQRANRRERAGSA